MQKFLALKNTIESYCGLSAKTWKMLESLCVPLTLDKNQCFTSVGQIPQTFAFVCRGLLRAYVTDSKGNEYNKVFFEDNSFPGSMVALLTASPSHFTIECLERSSLLSIDFKAYRQLLMDHDDLKWFQILYLEKNWIEGKERHEIALVQENATQRYLRFKEKHPGLEQRISQYNIASHLGITPTQLSRIRKQLQN